MTKNGKDTIIVGGGFYGLSIALYLYEHLGIRDIRVIEKEHMMMSRASYANQARVHNGYHYPRSVLTAHRSAINFPVFVNDHKNAIVSDFDKYYAIAKQLSKVNANQFIRFTEKIGIEARPAEPEIKAIFNKAFIEDVFKVKEYAFDSYKLCEELLERIRGCPGIRLYTNETVKKVTRSKKALQITTDKSIYSAEYVLNCAYSSINTLHRLSNIPLIPLKHEVAELCLVRLPKRLEKFSVTVMDGPFFSIMPFPTRGLYSLSHVRYTPHESWIDDDSTSLSKLNAHTYLRNLDITTNFKQMYNDVIRYIPDLKDMEYVESIMEVKTVLLKSESDDSRPILFKANHGLKNYVCIMGGKLDNIYDVFEALEELYG